MKMHVKTSVVLMAFALSACDYYAADDLRNSDFGTATAQNLLVQTGSAGLVDINTRFSQTVPTMVNFAFNSSALDATARGILDQQARFIRGFPMIRFRVYGHTDLVGSEAFNQGLGMRRAQAVVAYLLSQGVSRGQVEAVVSKGKTQPLVNTPNPERINRRTLTQVAGMAAGYNAADFDGKRAAIVYNEYVLGTGPEISSTDEADSQ
jgi:peptidoglycan-associated lipoprotein